MANELRVRQNFLGGLIEDNPLSSSATTLTSTALAAMQAIGTTQHMAITLDPDGIGGDPEIVWITAHTAAATTATILRAQEGTTARAHNRDTPWVHGPTTTDVEKPRTPLLRIRVLNTGVTVPMEISTDPVTDNFFGTTANCPYSAYFGTGAVNFYVNMIDYDDVVNPVPGWLVTSWGAVSNTWRVGLHLIVTNATATGEITCVSNGIPWVANNTATQDTFWQPSQSILGGAVTTNLAGNQVVINTAGVYHFNFYTWTDLEY